MERSSFDAMTADDARVKATEETDEGRRAAWWELAAAIDTSRGTTAGHLPEETRDRLHATTGAASATITPELLARSLGRSDEAEELQSRAGRMARTTIGYRSVGMVASARSENA